MNRFIRSFVPTVERRRGRRRAVQTLLALVCLATTAVCADAADKAAIKKAIAQGAGYLRSIHSQQTGGRATLAAYAMLKAGIEPTDASISKTIADVLKRCEGAAYQPQATDSLYSAGLEAMLLADAHDESYQPALKKIATWLESQQHDDGGFNYRGPNSVGDTSVTQYATLGFWACARSGVEIPPQVWDKIATWHVTNQMSDGGFQYNPGTTEGHTGGDPNLTMTAAAAASMVIAAMHLYPQQSSINDRPVEHVTTGPMEPRDPNDPLGVLSVRKPDPKKPAGPAGPYKPQTSFADLQKHIHAAVTWTGRQYTPEYREDIRLYNYYTLERMGALTEEDQLGGHDWYEECSSRLIASQKGDGSWTTSFYDTQAGYCVGTSFAVLFLTRSTARLINRIPPDNPIGGGMQAGGRGLPDDLSSVKMQDGRVAKEESLGALDDLLKSLESGAGDDLFNLQTQIVKKIQLGDRTELIGQTDRLIKLLEYPSPEIRRTALWALARSDDLTMARYAVAALEDPDTDVLIEAHNALCWLSRRPNAFDIPDNPLEGLPPDATDEQKQAAVEKWRANALQKWGTWYLRMCTYEERNTPFAYDLAKKIGLR